MLSAMVTTPVLCEGPILCQGPIAAGWIDGLGPLIVVFIWIVRQVMVAVKEQKDAARARGDLPPEGDEAEGFDAPHGEAQPQPPAERGVRSEVEEFLRRVEQEQAGPAERRGEPVEQRVDPKRRVPVDPFEEPPHVPPRQTVRPQRPRPKPTPSQEIEVEPLPRQTAEPVRAKRQELRHLPESQLAEQAAHLGEGIASADGRVESRLHDTFDHRLGKLGSGRPREEEAPKPTPESQASKIRSLLARPEGVREAIILSEILRRPSDDL